MFDTSKVDITNRQVVTSSHGGETIVVMAPAVSMSREEALVLAAWLVALADHDQQFPEILARVEST